MKNCVYDQLVADELLKIGTVVYDDIFTVQERYPGVNFKSMILMALHQAATIATNVAKNNPIDKKWDDVP